MADVKPLVIDGGMVRQADTGDVVSAPDYKMPSMVLGTSTYSTLGNWIGTIQSSGRISGMTVSVHAPADGSVDITAGTGIIKSTNAVTSDSKFFDFAGANIALIDNQLNYIYISYDAGIPALHVTTDRSTIHEFDQFILGRAYRVATIIEPIVTSGNDIYNNERRIQDWLVRKFGFTWTSGSALSEVGTRNLATTAGQWYIGLSAITTPAQDTNIGGNTFDLWYYSGAAWTLVAAQSQLPVTQWNDITAGLVPLTGTTHYGVYWVYIDPQGNLRVVYGQAQYLPLSDATNAKAPSFVPNIILATCVLIGRIIFAKSVTHFNEIDSALVTVIGLSPVGVHNQLGGLQGGIIDEYYHLTATQDGIFGANGQITLPAGTITAGTAPIKLTSGTSMTTAEVGAWEFTTDDLYFTITTGAARKGVILNNGSNLTSGKIPVATTNGRLIDGPTDASANWNTAYGWGNWAHTTLAGYGITNACPLAHKTTEDALTGLVKCDGVGNYSAVTDNTRPSLTNNSGATVIPICTPVYIVTADKIAPAKADAVETTKVVALATAAVAISAAGICQTEGVLVATTAQWDVVTGGAGGLTAGSVYYLSNVTAGLITTTAPTTGYVVEVGQAISTTELNICIKAPIKLSTAAAGQGGISLSANQVAYANGSGQIVGSGNMTFDGTNETVAGSVTAQQFVGWNTCPIGSIIAWLKTYTNTPQTLPVGWMECHGGTVIDPVSPYYGQTLPNLMDNNYFLRGASTSGGTGGEDTHTLSVTEIPAHTHNVATSTGAQTGNRIANTNSASNESNIATDNGTGGGTAHENKPPYYNVVWIIRIK